MNKVTPLPYSPFLFYKEQGYVSVGQNPCFVERKRWSQFYVINGTIYY